MSNNADIDTADIPKSTENTKAAVLQETMPEKVANEVLIPIKFNKELKNITEKEASALAQKGLKFDMISDNYDRIKKLALSDHLTVASFINALEENKKKNRIEELTKECGGNSAMAEHIMMLESEGKTEGDTEFKQLKSEIDEIKTPEDVPEEVYESAKIKGTSLLDEYLRYKYSRDRTLNNARSTELNNSIKSVGSQREFAIPDNPETLEFLKGLWNK